MMSGHQATMMVGLVAHAKGKGNGWQYFASKVDRALCVHEWLQHEPDALGKVVSVKSCMQICYTWVQWTSACAERTDAAAC